jgi:predicted dehydrogenase
VQRENLDGDLGMSETIGWGVVGTGAVTRDFSRALASTPGARLAAVTSRDPRPAQAFATELGFAAAHADVQSLCADPSVDLVYVASPTAMHMEHSLTAIAAGKGVVCEKPFTTSAKEAAEVVAAAREAHVFCMEGMWLRFNTIVMDLKEKVSTGAFGPISSATVTIGHAKAADALGHPEDARGAVRTFGCYGFNLAVHLFGPATAARSVVHRDAAGVDTDAAVVLDHGASTTLIDTSVSSPRSNRLEVSGGKAIAVIPRSIIDPRQLLVRQLPANGRKAMLAEAMAPLADRLPSAKSNSRSGFRGEIAEAMRCVREGLTESPVMPLDQTLHVQDLMDAAVSIQSDAPTTPGNP